MPQQSAGILLYRFIAGTLQVLLVHPGGPYFARKDEGVWSVPKGLFGDDEEGLMAAKREFKEELGQDVPATDFIPMKAIRQKGGKVVHAWAAEGNLNIDYIKSNTFSMEYPYKSGNWREFPEIDRAGWFAIPEAELKILPAQKPLLAELVALLQSEKQ